MLSSSASGGADIPATTEETALEKFAREHAKEILELPVWDRKFAAGLKRSDLGAKLGQSWEQIEANLTSANKGVQFYMGYLVGLPVGAVTDVYLTVKSLAEVLVKAFFYHQEIERDPRKLLSDLREFAYSLPSLIIKLLDADELGYSVGMGLANKLDEDLIKKDPYEQGKYIGMIAGAIIMEVALLFIGVEEVSAAAKAIRATRLGEEIAEGMSLASKELKTILETRGVLEETKILGPEAAAEKKIVGGAEEITEVFELPGHKLTEIGEGWYSLCSNPVCLRIHLSPEEEQLLQSPEGGRLLREELSKEADVAKFAAVERQDQSY
jgi:hypothetical protein